MHKEASKTSKDHSGKRALKPDDHPNELRLKCEDFLKDLQNSVKARGEIEKKTRAQSHGDLDSVTTWKIEKRKRIKGTK